MRKKLLFQSLMKEERLIYFEEHPTKASDFYTRSLKAKFGTIEDLSVPRVREGNFRPSDKEEALSGLERVEENWKRVYLGGW